MKCLGLLICLVAGVLAAPRHDFGNWEELFVSKESECGDLQRLSNDATTIFTYEGETRNTIKGSTPDDTGLLVKARIYIHPLKACRFSLQVNEAELLTKSKTQNRFLPTKESKKFKRELQAQDLTFQVSNGKITKLFPAPGEKIHVLNTKRGILSTLQLGNLKTTQETDVNGRCKVNVVEKDGEIIKYKKLSECSERALNEVGFQTTAFQRNDLPIKPLNSTSVCTYTTVKNKIRSVNCLETHIFRPFSAGYESPSGAITIVKQKLTFQGQKSGFKLSVDEEQTEQLGVSLIYQHENEQTKPGKGIFTRTDVIMKNLVDTSKANHLAAKQNSAHEFTELVGILRKLNRKTMVEVWDKYFNCEKSGICSGADSDIKNVYRQYLLDALTYCGTDTCIYTVHNVIVDGQVAGETIKTFLQGIALVAKPTKAMIRDVLNIAKKIPSRQSFFTLGTLMYRYCTVDPAQCTYHNKNPITHAELFLEEKLGKDCLNQEGDERVEEILMSLKAIGNAGRPVRAWKTLLACAQTALHQNISIAALDALRRMPCNQEVQSEIHKIHENVDIEPERRIHVYLALMKCPTESTIRRVTEQLEKEKSRQVGAFMASHLKNLNESSDPRHEKVQKLLSTFLKKDTLKNFDLDYAKYSRAFEGSLHSSYLRSGASVESHLIFSPNSYLPRSAFMNMTATILDVPVNVLEMAARVEGFETLLEDLFGEDGYFPDNSILKLFNITFTKDDIVKLRSRRSVKDESIDENIAELHERINKKRVRPSGNLNIKVFGHEIRVFSYDDIFWAVDQIDNMNVIELLLKFAKGGHKTFTKSMLFLEMTHSVPTGLGWPLKLKLTGSTVASLELNGKFDIRNMFWGPSSMEVKGFIRPSAVVELSGQMAVHNHHIDSGIFVNSTIFTSQKLKGSVVYKEGQTLQINLDAPEEPNQIFNVSSTPFLFLNDEIDLVKGAPRRITPDFCVNSTIVLGLGLCTKLSLPVAFREYESPYFPLSGPSSFGMNLIKADPKLTSYQLSVNLKKMNTMTKNEFIGWFEMGTPGATYSRRLAGIVKYAVTRTTRTLTVGSFEGGIINGDMVKNKIEFVASYNNNSNRVEMDLRSNLFTRKTMKMKFLYFNDTHFIGRQMGVLLSAEYDWYKFQHTLKFVNKVTSYLLHSRTTYWPKKHLTSEVELIPATKTIAVRFNANQINQSVEMIGKYVKTKSEKGLKFTATHLTTMKKTSFYVGILNEKLTKKFIINGTVLGKKAELTWGYYNRDVVHEVKFDANVFGQTMAVFADYNKMKEGLLGATLGATVNKHKIGISTEYVKEDNSFDRELCSFIFYNDKTPVKSCLSLKKVPSSWTSPEYKRLVWTTKVLKKFWALAFDYKSKDDKCSLTTTATFGDEVLFKNNWELMYETMWNTELKMTMEMGKKTVSTKLFSTMLKEDLCTFGIKAEGFKQMLQIMATYSKETKEDIAIHGVILEGWVNKKLPLNFSVILELGKTMKGLSTILKSKSLIAKTSMIWLQPEANKYSGVLDFAVSKENLVLFKSRLTDILVWSDAQKAYKLMWEFVIWNKKFEYGWDLTYQDLTTAGKTAHSLTIGLNYARNRRSTVTTTLVNSNKKFKILIDVGYLPARQVSHVISFHKQARQLDIILEFLPKMFVKLRGKLDKIDGWRLTTDLTFDWVKFKRVFQWMAAYVNTTDTKGLNFQFLAYGKNVNTGLELNDKTKTAVFTISGFGRGLKLVGYWLSSRGLGGVRFLTERKVGGEIVPTELIEALATYSKEDGEIALELRTPSKSLVRTVGSYNKFRKIISLEFFALNRDLLKLTGQYKKYEKTLLFQTFILGKERFHVVSKYDEEEKTIFVNLDAMKKNVMFAAKWDSEKKQVSFSTEVLNRIFGFVARFDPKKYVSSFHVFYQKNLVGWTVYLDKKNKALVYNVTLTPKLSAQIALEILRDQIIKLTFQRKIGKDVVSEAALKYELASESSKLALQWNRKTLKAARDIITPIVEAGIQNVTALAHNLKSFTKRLSMELLRNVTSKFLTILNKADESFDKFDFVAARDKMAKISAKLLRISADLASAGLEKTSHLLTKTHETLPAIMEKTLKLSKSALDLAKVAYKIAKNLTESGLPVVKTAIKLTREFKVRGKTIDEIIKQVLDLVKDLSKKWKKNMAIQLEELKKDITEYVKEIPIPYRTEKVGEIYDKIVAELQTRTENFDWEKTAKKLVKFVFKYEIVGKPLKDHILTLNSKMQKLPEIIKKTAVNLIGQTRVHLKKTKKYLKNYVSEVQHFSLPLVNLLKKLHASVTKHFSPVVEKAGKKLITFAKSEFTKFMKMYEPLKLRARELLDLLEKFFMPLLRPFRPLYEDLKDQVRGIRLLEQELGEVFDSYVEDLKVNGKLGLKNFETAYNKMVEKTKTMAFEMMEMTPEEIAEATVDNTIAISKKTFGYVKKVYESRVEILKKLKIKVDKAIETAKEVYGIITSKPVEELVHVAFTEAGESVIKVLKETALIIDQIALIDVLGPLERLWNDLDLLTHFEKFGINAKIMNAIDAAKMVNLTETLFKSIANLRKLVKTAYMKAEEKLMKAYEEMLKVYKYILSIPKKDFEEFYTEVETFLKNKWEMKDYLKKIYSMTYKGLIKMMNVLEERYKEYYDAYGMPLKIWYSDVKEHALMVYEDNKDDSVKVYNYYKAIISGIIKEKYQKLLTKIEKKYSEVNKKILNLYNKYADMTWEEIGTNLADYGKKKGEIGLKYAKEKLKKAKVLATKAMKIAKELYKNMTIVVKKTVAYISTTIKTRVRPYLTKVYRKTVNIINTTAITYYKKVSDIYIYSKDFIIGWYSDNKSKSLRMLYLDVKAILIAQYKKNMEKTKAIFEKHYGKILTRLNKMKDRLVTIKDQVLPIVKEEAESVINQTLRSAVVLANETAKAYYPHYKIIKGYMKTYYVKGKNQALKIYISSKEKAVQMYVEALKQMKLKVKHLVKLLKDLAVKIKTHPAYEKIINHKMVNKATKWLKEVSEKLDEQLTEFREKVENHPRMIELKDKISEYKKQLKDKMNEYKEILNEYKKHPKMKEVIDVLKQINESGIFTALKLKEKLTPHVTRAHEILSKIPELALSKVSFFQQYPEECFWSTVKNLTTVLETLRSYEWKTVHKKTWAATKDLIDEITDDRTKGAALNAIALSQIYYRKLLTFPLWLKKQCSAFCRKEWEWISEKWALLKEQWKNCAVLYPIINHEIWGEFVEEFLNHEIVSELKILALKGKEKTLEYKEKLLSYARLKKIEMKEKMDNLVKDLKKRFKDLKTRFNTFVDETTLEDVVFKAKEVYEKTEKFIKNEKDKLVKKLKENYKIADEKFTIFYSKAKVIGDKYIEKVKIMWEKKYPKLIAKAEMMWNDAKIKAEGLKKKYIELVKGMKEEYTRKASKLWDESELKQKLLTLKKMTVRETLEEIMKLPEKTKVMAKKLYNKALTEVKTRYNTYLLPYVHIASKNAMIVFNEINETAVFIYRYYRLKDNFYKFKGYLNNMRAMTENEIYKIAPKVSVVVKEFLKRLGKTSLKAVHCSMVYVDNVNIKPYVRKVQAYIPDLRKYITLNTDKGEFVLTIPHYKPIEPSLTHHINKVAENIESFNNSVRLVSTRVLKKTVTTTKLMLQKIKARTYELRKDLDASLLVHKKLGLHVLGKAKVMGSEAYNITLGMSKDLYDITKEISDVLTRVAKKQANKVYALSKTTALDIYSSDSLREILEKTRDHSQRFVNYAKSLIMPYYKTAVFFAKEWYKDMKLVYSKIIYKMEPYYLTIKTAVKDWRSGTDSKTAFRVVQIQLKKTYRTLKADFEKKMEEYKRLVKSFIGTIDEETWELLDEYVKTHKAILGKYSKRIFKLYKFTKARLDRAIRIAKIMSRKVWKKPIEVMNPYRSVAMIFGKTHVMTFDGKYYDFPSYLKPHCTYLLARDFQRGKFTVLSQKEHLIVITPDIRVTITHSKVESVVKTVRSGQVTKKTIHDLPVQSESGSCKRWGSFIKCQFKQGLRIKCDVDHFLCTVELSGWQYSKSQGLLGTNNHEIYDEMKLPDGRTTESMTKFANAWEVSGDRTCLISESRPEKPACNKAPSEQCFKLLKEKKSKYSPLFHVVNPMPFLKACQIDSADCDTKEPYETSHCNATAAYVQMLRLKGVWARLPEDCARYTAETGKTYNIGEKWTQPSTRSADVVIMISERSKAKSLGKTISKMIFNLDKTLTGNGYLTRYALIGFAGDGVYERPHYRTPDGNMFNDATTVATTIKNMLYTGTSENFNDVYSPLVLASLLRFRPSAERFFLLINSDTYKPCWYGPTLDETIMSVKHESNATLFAFDNFNFKSVSEGKVIGQTEKKVYLYPYQVLPLSTELPRSPFTKLVKLTDGGMFTNKLKSSQEKIVEKALTDSFLQILKTNTQSCKSCRLERGCGGQALPVCRNDNRVKC